MTVKVKCDICKKKKDLKGMKTIYVSGTALKVCAECWKKMNKKED